MWRDLIQTYALRARELSDTVAALGKHERLKPESLALLEEIERRRRLCEEAAEKLERYIEQQEPKSMRAG